MVLGRPVFFVDDDPEADREAQDTLVQVANKLGFKEVSFQYEPIAAAFDYERGIQREELVLIVDIGGGTSDFSLVRLAPERRNLAERQDDILATGGVHIGGTDFDKQLSLEGVMPLFGYGSRMKSDAFMPTSYHLNLATWHTINAVYAQKSQLALKNTRYDIVDSTGIDRLFRLIEERAGHWLAMQVEDSKIRLTETERLHLSLERIEAGLGVELTRGLFENAVDGLLERVRNSVAQLLAWPGSTRTGSTRCSSPAVRAVFRRCAGASRRCCPTPVMSRATCSAASAAAWPSRRRSAMAEPPWSCPCPIGDKVTPGAMADNRERLSALRQDHATPSAGRITPQALSAATEPGEGGAHFFRQVLANALRSSPLSALAVASALQVFIFSCWVAALARRRPSGNCS